MVHWSWTIKIKRILEATWPAAATKIAPGPPSISCTIVRPMASMHVKFEIKMNWKWKLIVRYLFFSSYFCFSFARLFHYIYGEKKEMPSVWYNFCWCNNGVQHVCMFQLFNNWKRTNNQHGSIVHLHTHFSPFARTRSVWLDFAVWPQANATAVPLKS